MIADRLLKTLLYCQRNPSFLDAGFKIGGASKPVEALSPLLVLYYGFNARAS